MIFSSFAENSDNTNLPRIAKKAKPKTRQPVSSILSYSPKQIFSSCLNLKSKSKIPPLEDNQSENETNTIKSGGVNYKFERIVVEDNNLIIELNIYTVAILGGVLGIFSIFLGASLSGSWWADILGNHS